LYRSRTESRKYIEVGRNLRQENEIQRKEGGEGIESISPFNQMLPVCDHRKGRGPVKKQCYVWYICLSNWEKGRVLGTCQ